MATAQLEPVLVEPRANLLGGVDEEAVQLDAAYPISATARSVPSKSRSQSSRTV